MPAPSSMTFGDAASEVLARIGQLDDGVANPLLVAEAKAHINAAQRKLIVEHGLQAMRRKILVEVYPGRRFIDLPSDARLTQIQSAVWVDASGARIPLTPGIPLDTSGMPAQFVSWYDTSPSTGIVAVTATGGAGYTSGVGAVTSGSRLADGHDPQVSFTVSSGALTGATILDSGSQWSAAPVIAPNGGGAGGTITVTIGPVQLIELCPVPGSNGTLEIEYRAVVAKLVDENDLLALDAEAVISRAAVLLSMTKGLPSAVGLERDFVAYMSSLRSQQGPGRVMNLAGWRRRGEPRTPQGTRRMASYEDGEY